MGLLSSWSTRVKGQEITERESEPPERGGSHLDPRNSDPRKSDPGSASGEHSAARMAWTDICRAAQFRGRWVALCECHYDESTGKATEGAVVDVDDDLVELCSRIRASDKKNCAILFCDETAESH